MLEIEPKGFKYIVSGGVDGSRESATLSARCEACSDPCYGGALSLLRTERSCTLGVSTLRRDPPLSPTSGVALFGSAGGAQCQPGC
jgi:hypothetical protein